MRPRKPTSSTRCHASWHHMPSKRLVCKSPNCLLRVRCERSFKSGTKPGPRSLATNGFVPLLQRLPTWPVSARMTSHKIAGVAQIYGKSSGSFKVTGECLVIPRCNTALHPASIDINLTVPLEKTANQNSSYSKIALIAIFFSGGDRRLSGGKRRSLDGWHLWVNAAC